MMGSGDKKTLEQEKEDSPAPKAAAAAAAIAFKLVTGSTPDSQRDNNVAFLDRQNVKCTDSNSVFNRLHMVVTPNDQIHYDYSCLSASDIGAAVTKTTNEIDNTNDTTRLADFNINCDSGYGIGRLQLTNAPNNKQRYEYSCLPVPNATTCVTKTTNLDANGMGNLSFLDRHDVKCGENEVLSQMRLKNQGNQMQYEYKCCSRK